MRSRLSLLVATTVLLTPGWHGDGSAESLQRSELAAIVLATPSEKGVIPAAASDMKHRLSAREAKRSPTSLSVAVVASGVAAFVFLLLQVISSSAATLVHLFQLRARFIRGLPLLHAA